MDYTLVKLAQTNAETNKRNARAEEYLARNSKGNDLMLFLSALSIPMSLMAAYFVCCLF